MGEKFLNKQKKISPMEAQIIKCSGDYWYKDKVGETYEVFEQSKLLPFTSVFNEHGECKIISNDDIVILN